jgi:hypothetical protein
MGSLDSKVFRGKVLMIRPGAIVVILLYAAIFSVLPGCGEKQQVKLPDSQTVSGRKTEEGKQPEGQQLMYELSSLMLYQKHDLFKNALAFIDAPAEEYLDSVNGALHNLPKELAKDQQLVFANKLFILRISRDTDMFISLLSEGSRQHLDDIDNKKSMLHHYMRQVKDGTFLYGEYDGKFFATFCELSGEFLNSLSRGGMFSETPSHAIIYWHYHKPKTMLIGTTFYLIKDGQRYKLVTYT